MTDQSENENILVFSEPFQSELDQCHEFYSWMGSLMERAKTEFPYEIEPKDLCSLMFGFAAGKLAEAGQHEYLALCLRDLRDNYLPERAYRKNRKTGRR